MAERLQKVLAEAGLGSRREIETWIRAGRLRINGNMAQLGDRVGESDRIQLDGRTLSTERTATPERRVIAYHKPVGEMTTRADPEGRPTIFENMPRLRRGRWIAVGRLDLNTAGLILLTTDGELANRLMHPSAAVEREYAVRVLGTVDEAMLQRLGSGVELDDGMAHFSSIADGGGEGANHWYHVVLREGRNREVRRLWESQGIKVSRLTRVRYGPVRLHRELRTGKWAEVPPEQVNELLQVAGLPVPPPTRPSRSKPGPKSKSAAGARRPTAQRNRPPRRR